MKHSIAMLLVTLSAPGLALAQEVSFSGAATIGYGSHDLSDTETDLSTRTLDGRVGMDFGNGFSFGVDVGLLDANIDDVPLDLDARSAGLNGAYRFANGLSVGLYHERLTASIDMIEDNITLKSTGLSFGYEAEALTLGAFIGDSSTSPEISSDIDVRDYGLTATYGGIEQLSLGVALLRTTIKTPDGDADIDLIGLAANYAINDQFSVFAGISQVSQDDLDFDTTTFGLGVSYDLPEYGGFASTVSLELAQSDLSLFGSDVGDLDTVRLGLTIPLGGTASKAPLNSVADSIFNPRRSAVSAGLTGAF